MTMRKYIASLLLCSLAGTAAADVSINGFGSIRAGLTLDSDDTLYGYTDDIDFKNESLMALQLKSDLGDKLSVTTQIMARGEDDFSADFEWAFITYDISDNMFINVGRLRTPFYKYSDFKDVGFAYDWARVPKSVYNLDFNNIEGISFYRNAQVMGLDSSLQFIYGSFAGQTVITGQTADANIDNIAGVAWELGRDGVNVRLAYLRGDTTFTSPDFTAFVQQLHGFGLSNVATALDVNEESSSFTGLAVSVDKYNWIFNAEITKAQVDDSVVSDQNGYYLSLGYRFDDITPYVSFEETDNDAKSEIYAGIPTQSPLYAPLFGIVQGFADKTEAWNVGVKYNFHYAAALKVQFTHSEDDIAQTDADLLTFGVDLVF